MKLRLAQNKDIKFILNLYNQNIIEKKFFSRKKANLKDHKIWLSRNIKRKMFYVALLRKRIGYIRFDQINKKNLSVSIAIDRKYKRKGYGTKILLTALNKEKISEFNVLAKIKKGDLISKNFFLNSGFKFLKDQCYVFKQKKNIKIQILISKSSWANNYKKEILNKLKKFSNKIMVFHDHRKLKNNYDLNIIFSYFKILPRIYLKKSKINLVPHESNLPKGRGMSPLTWQILKNKKKITFSLIEAGPKVDSGLIYYQIQKTIPRNALFNEIKKIQFNENLKLLIKFIKFYRIKNLAPKSKIQIGKSTFYKRRKPENSEININKSILSQFNLLRVSDYKNYPAYFKIYGKRYLLKIKEY